MRLRSLADFSTQIVLRTTSHNPDVVLNPLAQLTPLRFVHFTLGFRTMCRGCSSLCRPHSARFAHGLRTTAGYATFPCKESSATLYFLYCGNDRIIRSTLYAINLETHYSFYKKVFKSISNL